MSFGFGVGDFLAVGTLCWKLYQNVYKVSRDAPEELRGIRDELGALSNTIRLLNDDIQDPHSVLKQPGQENRFNLAADIMKSTNNTLQQLQTLAEKHELLRTQGTGGSRRQYLKIQWDRLKFAKEWNAITDLRAKLLYHNNQLSLLLQVLNNSSLERLQKEEKRTQKLIEDVHMAVYGAPNIGTNVATAPFLNTKSVEELTEAFLVNAQSGTRPWATIGVDSWLQAGRWWLIKAQSSLYTAHPGSPAYTQAFVDLLKSSWILTNIISMHPQRKLIVSTDPRDHLIEGLARALQAEHDKLAGLSLPEPSSEQLRSADLSIWAPAKITSLMPVRDGGANSARSSWKTQDGEILLQRHVHRLSKERIQLTLDAGLSFAYQVYPESVNGTECIVILEVQSQRRSVTFIAQGVDGQDIVRIPLYSEETDSCDKHILVQLSEISLGSSPAYEWPHYMTDAIACVSFSMFKKSQHKISNAYETAFRLVDAESRDTLSAFGSGIWLLTCNFVHPPINLRSLEAAAVLSCSSTKVDVLRRFGTLKLPPQESNTPTEQLCTLASQAMVCLGDCSLAGLPTFLRPSVLLFEESKDWPYLFWLSPTAEDAISLAQITGSVQYLHDCKLECLHSAFVKGCPLFFDKILKFFDIRTQGRLEWTMDNGFNPEGMPSSDIRLLVRAILQSGDRLFIDFFLDLTSSSSSSFSLFELSDVLLEAAISMDKDVFERVLDIILVKGMSIPSSNRMSPLAMLLCRGLQDFPVWALEWLLDLLPEKNLPPTEIEIRTLLDVDMSEMIQLFVFGSTTSRHLKLKNTLSRNGIDAWIIPALFRQDQEIISLFLDRGVCQLHPLRLMVSWGPASEEQLIPPDGMPDLPLFCAVFLAFEPEFILFLCLHGAYISDSARPGQPQCFMIEEMTSTLAVDQARSKFCTTSRLLSEIFHARYLSLHTGSSIPKSCLGIAKDIARKHCSKFAEIGGFDAKLSAGSDTECVAPRVEVEWPSPLQTQENWDKWRTEVLQILREHYATSQGV